MTRTRYGLSPWVHAFPKSKRLEFPRFSASASRLPASVPAVIIGGGLAGCCTAYALAAAGVNVMLLEADRIGLGGSARGPGILQGEASPSFRELDARVGKRAARAMFDASRRAVLELAATARRLGIKPPIETHHAFRLVSPFGGDEKALARELAARRDAGLDGVYVRGAAASREAGVERLAAGARFRDWGQADPYRLVVGFAAAASARGAHFFERSPVRRITFNRRNAEVQTEGGVVKADVVIVCTGEPTDLFRSLKRHVHFQDRYVVLTDRLPGAVRKQLSWRSRLLADNEVPPHLIRWTADDRVAIAGADQARTPERGREKVLVQRTGQLMYELSRLYPAISGVMPEYGWHMPVATTADGAMYAGPHRNYPHHLFAWATRHDPGQAFLASRVLLRHVLGEAERDDAYFGFTRG